MTRVDPFYGYSMLLRILLYVVLPAFGALQFVRLRRAFHVFQLESYKRAWFRRWIRERRSLPLFLTGFQDAKKPLVMTGRAWRTVIAATVASVVLVLGPAAAAHLVGGAPWDLIAFVVALGASFFGAPWLLLAADIALEPLQTAINHRYTRMARRRLAEIDPSVVAITGSYGKTSTKAAVAGLLGEPDEVLATPASFNTPLGVVRTINEHLRNHHRFFVVEMGARREGDIKELCELVGPDIAVLTSVGTAHLESFGSVDAIRRGKYEIVQSLSSSGTAVMNVDDRVVRELADRTGNVEVVRCGLDADGAPHVTARDIEVLERGTAFTLVDHRSGETASVRTRLLGRHALVNILLAVGVARTLGRSFEEIAGRVARLEPVEHRLQIIEGAGGVTVIDDAYNSNPSGAAAALDVLAAMPARRRVLVTPGMIELGEMQEEANERFAAQAARVADTIIVVARINRAALTRGAESAGVDVDVVAVDSLAQATDRLRSLLGPGDVVLFENDLPDQLEG